MLGTHRQGCAMIESLKVLISDCQLLTISDVVFSAEVTTVSVISPDRFRSVLFSLVQSGQGSV